MNIYLVERDLGTGWDEYKSFVCIAQSAIDARLTHPSPYDVDWDGRSCHDWVDCRQVTVTVLGTAHGIQEARVVCSDYNAG